MRKFIVCLILILFCISFYAQSANTEEYFNDNSNYKRVYCQLLGQGKFLSNQVSVKVDFGQKTSFWNGGANQELVDEEGKNLSFNSMVDAMNYMGSLGWKFQQAYVVTVNNQNVLHWLLYKDILDDEELKDGILIKEDFKKAKSKIDSSKRNETETKSKYSVRDRR